MTTSRNRPFALRPTRSYDDCIKLCVKLKLVETMTHGDNEYIRYTRLGMDVFTALVSVASSIDTDEPLRVS